MIRIKEGVSLAGMRPEIFLAIPIMYSMWELLTVDQDMVISSGTEGLHKRGSLHYVGLAVDISTRDLPPFEDKEIASQIAGQLGEEYDVVLESGKTHIHIEYQPKLNIV